MTSLKQIEANRLNALRSTGPRTDQGKRRSRSNAVRHGLTAETVIAAFEDAADYGAFEASIMAEHRISTTIDRELVSRLASVLWRLRRSTSIESGLFQIQGELMENGDGRKRRGKTVSKPAWYDEFDVGFSAFSSYATVCRDRDARLKESLDSSKSLACCFMRISRLQFGTFELLTRYETALWRQAAQLVLLLQSTRRR